MWPLEFWFKIYMRQLCAGKLFKEGEIKIDTWTVPPAMPKNLVLMCAGLESILLNRFGRKFTDKA
jgi:hypothetical protein